MSIFLELVSQLTHVWQIQQGINVFRRALFNRRYAYQLQVNKPFGSYGVEQQARMVEDYYKKRELAQDYQPLLAFIPFAHLATNKTVQAANAPTTT